MAKFSQSITSVFKGSVKTFKNFPTVMAMAVAFTLIVIVKIESNRRGIEGNVLLLDSLQWAFMLGGTSSLAAITYVRTRSKGKTPFLLANIEGLLIAAFAFVLLYFFSIRENPIVSGLSLTDLSLSRMVVAIAISLIAFVTFAAYPKEQSSFSAALFMALKAFSVALVYGLVIGGGTAAIAATIEALLFPNMSSSVYAYLSTLAGFLAFTFFVGYFPDFDPKAEDPKREQAQDQPRFIEILFEYILIPIMLAFSLVLLIWVIRILLPGQAPLVDILPGTIGSYAIASIALHIFVTHYPSKLARFYRLVTPYVWVIVIICSLIHLSRQIQVEGLNTAFYWFILIATFTILSAGFILIFKQKAHLIMTCCLSILLVVAVLPRVGVAELPVRSQIRRVERILEDEGMLTGGTLTPATTEPNNEVKTKITNAITFLAWSDIDDLPPWFDRKMRDPEIFKQSFGFQMSGYTDFPDQTYLYTTLELSYFAMDIQDYDFVLQLGGEDKSDLDNIELSGDIEASQGLYSFVWQAKSSNLPQLTVSLGGQVLYQADIESYATYILDKYPLSLEDNWTATSDDMTYRIETNDFDLVLVFNAISISQEPVDDEISYWFDLAQIFFREN